MPSTLSVEEARVIGCLIEKSVITPDQYPLTLKGLTTACNQKSARDPVMALQQGAVQRTARLLEAKHFVRAEENFKRGTEKYKQRFCNSRYSDYQFDSPQLAIVCLLLLRGPQTPGELRAHSGRLHTFSDNNAVMDTLNSFMERDGDPILVKLPRTPGRKDAEYMHLFSGEIDVNAYASQKRVSAVSGPPTPTSRSDVEQRITILENEIVELRKLLETMS